MNGREKCERLKFIRKIIADKNEIDYNPTKCNHKGDCNGVCPKCEEEEEYILSEIKNREKLGLPIDLQVDLPNDSNQDKENTNNDIDENGIIESERHITSGMLVDPNFQYTGDISANQSTDTILPPPPEYVEGEFSDNEFEDWD